MDSLANNLKSHFNRQLDFFEEAVDEQLNTKADKTALDSKVDKLSVDTVLNENSNNPIANKVVTTRLKGMYEGMADKADRTELENYATKAELDTKADKFTIDNEVKADSNNPVSSKAVDSSLQEMGQEFSEQLETKANTTDIPTKLAQLTDDTAHRLVTDEERTKWNALKNVNVVTEVTEENANSEDPISTKLVV